MAFTVLSDFSKGQTYGGIRLGSTHLRDLSERVLVGLLVPENLLVVLERQGCHVTGDGRLLSDGRRRDGLFLPLNGQNEVPEVIVGSVGLIEIAAAVEVDGLPVGNGGRRLATVGFGREIEILPL